MGFNDLGSLKGTTFSKLPHTVLCITMQSMTFLLELHCWVLNFILKISSLLL